MVSGFVGIVGVVLVKEFDMFESLYMWVGVLLFFLINVLKYNLIWFIDGLINEYCNFCDVIVNGDLVKIVLFENYEIFSYDGVDYECFNILGGFGILFEIFVG